MDKPVDGAPSIQCAYCPKRATVALVPIRGPKEPRIPVCEAHAAGTYIRLDYEEG